MIANIIFEVEIDQRECYKFEMYEAHNYSLRSRGPVPSHSEALNRNLIELTRSTDPIKGTRYLTKDFVQKRDMGPFGVLSLKICYP